MVVDVVGGGAVRVRRLGLPEHLQPAVPRPRARLPGRVRPDAARRRQLLAV
jgi:hypothetical protein